jgi:cytochrome bd-type quinol oxidase subunit 1
MQILSLLKIIPLKLWIVGAVVIFLGLSAYQTFIGDRKITNIETVSPQPLASYESPSMEPQDQTSS